MRKRPSSKRDGKARPKSATEGEVRIIGGEYRRRRLPHPVHPGLRPMKDRTREALFNLLGGDLTGWHALDLFAGTGALGFEALSRGAVSATMIEFERRSARQLSDNARLLGVEGRCAIHTADAFRWCQQHLADEPVDRPWVVFISPPYELFRSQLADMLELISQLLAAAPPSSAVVAEPDLEFSYDLLPQAAEWQIRRYPPAQIGILWLADQT